MLSNGILETSTTTGTGNLTTSAVTGRPRITDKFTASATAAAADPFWYGICDQSNPPVFYECGFGYMSAVGTLVRARPTETYLSGTFLDVQPTAVNLPAGTKNVIVCATAGSFAMCQPTIRAGAAGRRIVNARQAPTIGNTKALAADTLYYMPFLVDFDVEIASLGTAVTSAAAAGKILQIGIYRVKQDGDIGNLIDRTANIAADSTGVKSSVLLGGTRRFPPAMYAIAIASNGTPSVASWNAINMNGSVFLGGDNANGPQVQYNWAQETLSGGWSSLPAAPTISSYSPSNVDFPPMAWGIPV